MAKTITIKSGKQVISIESDDAGVPDVTKDAGPDLMKLQNDAMASPNEENAEFNAAVDDSPVESEDKTQDVNKANESSFVPLYVGLEDGEEAAATEPDQSDTPVTPPAADTPAETPAEEPAADNGEGAGEVSEADGVTTIDTGDTIITISSSDSAAETPAEEPAADTPAETPAEEPAATENAPAEPEQNTDQAIESFFRNLGL